RREIWPQPSAPIDREVDEIDQREAAADRLPVVNRDTVAALDHVAQAEAPIGEHDRQANSQKLPRSLSRCRKQMLYMAVQGKDRLENSKGLLDPFVQRPLAASPYRPAERDLTVEAAKPCRDALEVRDTLRERHTEKRASAIEPSPSQVVFDSHGQS